MNGILFTDGKKNLTLDIAGYEFPHPANEEDAEWLTVVLRYADDSGAWTHRDNCLRAYELQWLMEQIDAVLAGTENRACSDFLEPYLKLSAERNGEDCTVRIRYVHDRTAVYEITEKTDLSRLREINEKLKAYAGRFPSGRTKTE